MLWVSRPLHVEDLGLVCQKRDSELSPPQSSFESLVTLQIDYVVLHTMVYTVSS
jgi:hypothetical protein